MSSYFFEYCSTVLESKKCSSPNRVARSVRPPTPFPPTHTFAMGRSKVIIKSIDDPVKRKATFQKRKAGVMKKAMELSVLCHCDIAFVMFDEHGDLYEFSSKDLKSTLKRAFNHKGKKEVKNNEALLRVHGVTKDRVEQSEGAPIGNRIDLTPAASCGLSLTANSFGSMIKGVESSKKRPVSPPAFAPSSPDRDDAYDMFEMPCQEDLEKSMMDLPDLDVDPVKTFSTRLPPKVQRNVDALMRDITIVHTAGELLHDPFVMSATQPTPFNAVPTLN
eukprot:COSAG06_NODE_121_length_23085_cov_7.727791_9_plen_276_part_00